MVVVLCSPVLTPRSRADRAVPARRGLFGAGPSLQSHCAGAVFQQQSSKGLAGGVDRVQTLAEAERLKLTASLFNLLAVNSIVLGVLGPAVAYISGVTERAVDGRVVAVGTVFFVVGCGLYGLGRYLLGGLRR